MNFLASSCIGEDDIKEGKMVRNVSRIFLCFLILFFLAVLSQDRICFADAITDVPDCTNGDCPPPPNCTNGDCPPPPDCTNGDCPPPPPDCTNGDCPPPPNCTNGDCPPEDPPADCCCVGSNLPGTTRICCCRSTDLDTVTCRKSLVLSTDLPEFHNTIDDITMDGFRPRSCDSLLQKFCNPRVETVCTKKKGKRICEKVVKRICVALEHACQYRFCGPDWFPFEEPTPDKEGCAWWTQIRECDQ
jgi:hypothetical protein